MPFGLLVGLKHDCGLPAYPASDGGGNTITADIFNGLVQPYRLHMQSGRDSLPMQGRGTEVHISLCTAFCHSVGTKSSLKRCTCMCGYAHNQIFDGLLLSPRVVFAFVTPAIPHIVRWAEVWSVEGLGSILCDVYWWF